MAQTAPPTVDALPTAPTTTDPTTFAARMDALIAAFYSFRTQLIALAVNVYNNAVDAYNNTLNGQAVVNAATVQANLAAASAATVAETANAAAWVSGYSYPQYANAISLIDYQTYRRKLAGSSTVDPNLDAINWISLSSSPVRMSSQFIRSNITIPDGVNALTVGPFEVSPDVTVAGLGSATWTGI